MNELVNLKNEKRLDRVVKISGTRDKFFPPIERNKTILIEGGEHFMIVDRAEEISNLINEVIKNVTTISHIKS